jgi:PPOX class probable F420-dependent enzyme
MAELTPEQRNLFEENNFAIVATVGKDGAPHATPVWVDMDDQGHIVVNSAKGRGWPANLSRDPRVAVTVFDHENPYRKISVNGHVVETTTEGAREQIDRMAKKYLGADKYGRPEQTRVLFRIAPDSIHTYNF